MRAREVLFASIVVLASLPALAPPAAASLCEGFEVVPFQGPSCPVPGGWEVLLADGTRAFTHGPDLAPAFTPTGMATNPWYPVSPPLCAQPGQRHVLVLYGHPEGAPEGYEERLDRMREMIAQMNGHLRLEAATEGADMSYVVRCDPDGEVTVVRVHLPTPHSRATFSTILSDIRAQGYDGRDNAIYLMFYEGQMGNVGGQGQWCRDERLAPDNCSTRPGRLGVNYGYFDDSYGPLVIAHENGHNLGAVQDGAPHSSRGAHCNDGRDTMCYADGASNSSYDGGVCADREWFDCGHDDYFDPFPEAGEYLATRWNVAHPYNPYILHTDRPNEAPVALHLRCVREPSPLGEEEACGLVVQDPDARFHGGGGNVSVTLAWGDGTSTELGPAAPGSHLSARHRWPAPGNYTLTATPRDDGAPPATGATISLVHRVACADLATGQLALGLAGQETPLSARTVAVKCAGQAYTLTARPLQGLLDVNDVDVCWLAGVVELRCDRTPGEGEAGLVPEGATHARLVLVTGAQASYRLEIVP